jgi:hypothetical protein
MRKKKVRSISSIPASYQGTEGMVYFNTLSVSDKFARIDFVPIEKSDKRGLRGILCKDLETTEKNREILWAQVKTARQQKNVAMSRERKRENRRLPKRKQVA